MNAIQISWTVNVLLEIWIYCFRYHEIIAMNNESTRTAGKRGEIKYHSLIMKLMWRKVLKPLSGNAEHSKLRVPTLLLASSSPFVGLLTMWPASSSSHVSCESFSLKRANSLTCLFWELVFKKLLDVFYGLFLMSRNIFFSVATALCDIKALGVKIVTLA